VLDVPSTQMTARARLMLSTTHRASQEIPTNNLNEMSVKNMSLTQHVQGSVYGGSSKDITDQNQTCLFGKLHGRNCSGKKTFLISPEAAQIVLSK